MYSLTHLPRVARVRAVFPGASPARDALRLRLATLLTYVSGYRRGVNEPRLVRESPTQGGTRGIGTAELSNTQALEARLPLSA